MNNSMKTIIALLSASIMLVGGGAMLFNYSDESQASEYGYLPEMVDTGARFQGKHLSYGAYIDYDMYDYLNLDRSIPMDRWSVSRDLGTLTFDYDTGHLSGYVSSVHEYFAYDSILIQAQYENTNLNRGASFYFTEFGNGADLVTIAFETQNHLTAFSYCVCMKGDTISVPTFATTKFIIPNNQDRWVTQYSLTGQSDYNIPVFSLLHVNDYIDLTSPYPQSFKMYGDENTSQVEPIFVNNFTGPNFVVPNTVKGINFTHKLVNETGVTISVTGNLTSWIHVSDNKIYGVPPSDGTYTVNVEISKAGYNTINETFTITVVGLLVVTNSPLNGAYSWV